MQKNMKRRVRGVCCGVLGAGCLALGAGVANAAPIAKGGQPAAQVKTELCERNWQIQYAAQELTNWVAKISGAALPVDDATCELPVVIYLGTPETSKTVAEFAKGCPADFEKLGQSDGFIIREASHWFSSKAEIYIAAKRTKGVLNGVYRFLERNSDIIWARQWGGKGTDYGTVYGSDPDLKNTVGDLVDVPKIWRQRYWTSGSAEIDVWQARLLNNWSYGYDGNLWPGLFKRIATLAEIGDMHVNFGLGIDQYYDSDPDIFPLVKGKRVKNIDHQLCFMNPKTAKLFAEDACKTIAGLPKRVRRYEIGLGDNHEVCECEEFCMKPIELPDGRVIRPSDKNFRSTQYAIFENRVHDIIKAKFPHMIPPGAAAYIFTAQAPAVKPYGGGGCYCPYVKNHKKPVYDDGANATWHLRAEEFKKAGLAFTGLYEYYLCTSTPFYYHAVMDVMQKDLQYYGDAMERCYLDAGYGDGPEARQYAVSSIEFWVASRLMWNRDLSVDELRHEYCRRTYREAGEIMYGYYRKLAEVYNGDPTGCYWNDDPVLACQHYVVENDLGGWVRETLAKAAAAAVHPSSKWMIAEHARFMLPLVEKAEKAPKKLTLTVKQITGKKPDLDLNGDFWKEVECIGPMTAVSHADKPAAMKVEVKLAHDLKNVYLVANFHWKEFHDKLVAAQKEGPPKPNAEFKWDTPCEIYFDGDYKQQGSYHFYSYMFNGQKYTGRGSSEDPDNPPWSVENKLTDDGMISLCTFPFTSLGIDISKGNKLGFMFLATWYAALNGGQWHAPTAFQNLMLEMK